MNSTQTRSRNVHIYLESNPNPNSLKFVANFMLLPDGESYDFPDAASAEHAPLAKELFALEHVERVFYMSNFVTVTKSEKAEWAEIQETIKQHIKQHLEDEKPILAPEAFAEDHDDAGEDDETVIKIKSILDEYIRPAVEQDGGAISFHSFREGIVKVLLQGSCSGCPSSTITLKAGIENLLKTMVPEVQGVEAEGV
ncbi:NifU family protein [Tunicatimonas pelagia]|uniref:NifU family protein n=1 Tax=Tunicatimonas pelagia TaxID=931531 RepID=UPI00266535EF|nr:NifU family protein [Tunicatimonas pelagia]WKN45078.1 NifU family protein [Tunicatimonas pelagia]